MTRILIESGHERNRNAGDEAYFAAMVSLFRKNMDAVELVTFSDRPEHDRIRYGVETIYSGGTILKSLFSIRKIINEIRKCDIYIWGAGQILRDDTHILAPPYRLSRPLLAYWMGKPVMAFGVGIGPLEKKPIRFMAKHVFKRFSLITYRDETTGKILKSLGLTETSIQKTVDPAFALVSADKKSIDTLLTQLGIGKTSQPLIGVAPFGPAFRGEFSGIRNLMPAKFQADRDMWQSGGKESYSAHVELLAEFYDEVIQKYQAKLIFIIQDASGQGLDDFISHDIISHLRHPDQAVVLNADEYPSPLFMGLMGRMKMVTGGRMHSLILASTVATPIMAICYERKIKALADVIDQSACFIDGYKIKNKSELIDLFDQIWDSRQHIINRLKQRNRELLDEVNRNVTRLKKLVKCK